MLMAALMLVGFAPVWLTPEPAGIDGAAPTVGKSAAERLKAWLGRAVLAPFADLVRRYGAAGLGLILLFTILYKLGEAVAGTMANPPYVLLGFTKVEIATVAKIYGVAATLAGVAAGGILVARLGVLRALLVSGVLQMLSNLMYVMQVLVGHDVAVLALTIGTENLTNGMGSAAFVAYLSGLCNVAFTATQYALLTVDLPRLNRGELGVGLRRLSRRPARLDSVFSDRHPGVPAGPCPARLDYPAGGRTSALIADPTGRDEPRRHN